MGSDNDKKLVESIYNVTTNPQRYDEFLILWQNEFLHIPDNQIANISDEINVESEKVGDLIVQHFFRAFTILELMDTKNKKYTTKQIIEADPLPSFILSQEKIILMCNEPAHNLLEIAAGVPLSSLDILRDDLGTIDNYIDSIENMEPDKLLSIIRIESNIEGEPLLFALSKINDPFSNANYIRLSGIHANWNDDVGVIIQNAFSLSDMELDIAKKLVTGMKLVDIALAKERSIYTIRAQNKSLFQKTNLNSQTDLIRLFSLLQNLDYKDKQYILPNADPLNKDISNIQRQNYLIRANGRKFYYEVYGAADGDPVLFMHGGISGTRLPKFVEDILIEKNIKLYSPHRAGFGYSEATSKADKTAELADDVLALFEQEGVQQCGLIGHLVGSFYAYYIANKLKGRITNICVIGGAVPFTSIHQINALKPRQRIITYTARYAPQLLPFLLKGAIAQIQQYGAGKFMQALFQDNASDLSYCNMKDTKEVIASGLEFSFGQGVGSVVSDAHYIFNADWDELVEGCDMPIELFHGTDDPAVPIGQVEEFLQNHSKIKLNIVDGGQMILFKHPETIFRSF